LHISNRGEPAKIQYKYDNSSPRLNRIVIPPVVTEMKCDDKISKRFDKFLQNPEENQEENQEEDQEEDQKFGM
jgi:hypothetical protein